MTIKNEITVIVELNDTLKRVATALEQLTNIQENILRLIQLNSRF